MTSLVQSEEANLTEAGTGTGEVTRLAGRERIGTHWSVGTKLGRGISPGTLLHNGVTTVNNAVFI
jgi:hypothetical protein